MQQDLSKFRNSVFYTISFVGLLWFIKIIESSFAVDLGVFGIHPRSFAGTVGILTGPLVHGDFHHLMSNSLPLLFLGIGVFYFYHRIALEVFVWIYLFTGFWVWVIARDAYHIGASGIVYGLASFLLFSGFFRKDSRSIAISLVVIFLYGGMAYGLFPMNEEISWESHLLGTVGGFVCAFFYRRYPLSTAKESLENPEMVDLGNMNRAPAPPDPSTEEMTQDHTHFQQDYRIRYFYKENLHNDDHPSPEN
ncbi:MAG: rhomboid family intramembrane serine protease [Cyclobacteriaceae bacterium]|nr:rhomboid family intramembrane serine protease [Cyclobacteriaceae bacterium]